MNRIHDFFKKHHVDEKDIPTAFVLYKSLGLVIAGTVFTICYKQRPIEKYMHLYPFNVLLNGFKNKFPYAHNKICNTIETKSTAISQSKYFKPIPNFFGLDPKISTFAIGETILVREILTPVTVPLKFWLVVNWMKKKNHSIRIKEGTKDTVEIIKCRKSVWSHVRQ
jgi:hypothetical protein